MKKGARRKTGPTEPLRVHILGIGEITTTIEIKGGNWGKIHPTEKRWMKLAYKRMPAFDDKKAADDYVSAHEKYQEILEELGIQTPWHDNLLRRRDDGKWVVYNRQERLETKKVACLVVHDLDLEGNLSLFRQLLKKLEPMFLHNPSRPDLQVGFDAQLPNWVLTGYDPEAREIGDNEPMVYIDTSTPLLRVDGRELLDTELFLRAIPAAFRPIIRLVALGHVVNRYYEPREVILDLVASYITHRRPDLVAPMVEEANRFMAESSFAKDAEPFTEKKISAYNGQDVAIWHAFRTLKRVDRYLGERFLGKTYEQRLPHGSPKKWKNLVGAGGMGLVDKD